MTERDFKGIVHFQECDYLPVESQKTRQNKQFASYLEGLLRTIYIHWEHIYGHVLRVIILGSGNVAVLSTFSTLSDTTETKSTLNIIKYHYLLYKK